jgi:cytosine deaminase
VIVAENSTFFGGDDYLRSRGVEVIVLDDQQCKDLMTEFIQAKPELWNEDIGV